MEPLGKWDEILAKSHHRIFRYDKEGDTDALVREAYDKMKTLMKDVAEPAPKPVKEQVQEIITTFRKAHMEHPLDADTVTILLDLLQNAVGNPVSLAA